MQFPWTLLEGCFTLWLHGWEYAPAALPVSGEAGQLSIPSSQDEEIQLFLGNAKKTTYLFISFHQRLNTWYPGLAIQCKLKIVKSEHLQYSFLTENVFPNKLIFSKMLLKFFWYFLISGESCVSNSWKNTFCGFLLKNNQNFQVSTYDSSPLPLQLLRESGCIQWFRSIVHADYEPVTWQILTLVVLVWRIISQMQISLKKSADT